MVANLAFLSIVWTVLIGFSCYWTVSSDYDSMLSRTVMAAEVAFEKDITYRRWNARSGGVYVPVSESTPANPYLDVPNRDIVTRRGLALTMVNPAYMTRQAHEIQEETTGVLGHITSLDPIRPGNAPDPWERTALEQFRTLSDAVVDIMPMKEGKYLRYMRPLFVEEACLRCHAFQGYELGQIRGGISVAVPLDEQLAAFHTHAASLVGAHLFFLLAGLAGILFGGRRVQRSMEATREASRRATEASKAKSEFLANMSHEVRTPLNGIVGMLELMKTTDLNREQQDYADMAEQSCYRLVRLVDDILDISRVEAGKLEMRNEPFDLRTLLDGLEEFYRDQFTCKGIDFRLDADPALPTAVAGDSARLQQVLANLVGNALKFTEQGAVTVSATALPYAHPGWVRVLFVVSDTGEGIAEELYPVLFEAFTQADGSMTRRFQGAGLGLAITARLVELMNGAVTVAPREGGGTKFYLSIPFEIVPDVERAELQVPPPRNDAREQGLQVLVAEDDATNQTLIRRMLEKCGHSVIMASDGAETLELLRQQPYDVIFMDVQMPRMDGVEATKRIRTAPEFKDLRDIRIVALTAHAMAGDAERFRAAGMDDYLPKPLSMAALAGVLANLDRR